MNELIKINVFAISSELVKTVCARELHVLLENGDHFTTWIKERISQFEFVEDRDFVTFSASAEKGRPRIEYAITLDMAKELSMVERNTKGRDARQYFIECERRALATRNAPAFAVPSTLSGALRLAAEQAETIETQALQLEAAKPSIEFVEKYVDATGSKGFRQVCKLLGAKENAFRDFLQTEGIMYVLGGEWTPHAQHLDAGRFEVKAGTSAANSHAYHSARFTPKGINWIAGEFAKFQLGACGGAA